MAIDSDYAQSMATQLAQSRVQGQLNQLNRNDQKYKAQQTALNSLDSALKTFKSAASALKTGNSKMLVSNATFSQEGVATASVKSDAVEGSYAFHVKQLASKSQVALSGLSDNNLGGSLKISLGSAVDNTFEVDLSTATSLADVAAAINNAADNKGVKATLVRSNDAVNLVLTSEKTGVDQAINLSQSGDNAALKQAVDKRLELSKAQDAEIYLGSSTGLKLTSSTNTFDNIIGGVSLTFNKAHSSADELLNIDIGKDQSASEANVKKFVDALNSVMSTFDSLTASGANGAKRGALAGDSSIRSIESMLNQVTRSSFGGVSLIDFGISSDRNGKLSIDSARFEKAFASNPEGLDKIFTEKGSLLETIDKNLSVYTAAGGVMANRKDLVSQQLRGLDERFEAIQKQYDTSYNRYLRQYNNLVQMMSSMNQTSGLFASE